MFSGNHPPQKVKTSIKAFKIMFEYSPKKNNAKIKPEYSMLYPATISASASDRSKGIRLVSARKAIKKTRFSGKKIKAFHKSFCEKTKSIKFQDPEKAITGRIDRLKKTS